MVEPWERYGFKDLTDEEKQIFSRYGPDVLQKAITLIFDVSCYHADKDSVPRTSPNFKILCDQHKLTFSKLVLILLNEGRSIEQIVDSNAELLLSKRN